MPITRRPKRRERFERFLLRLIQLPGGDRGHGFRINLLLGFLMHLSRLYRSVIQLRLFLYESGVLRRYPLGCQVISVGNLTVGGTGKTPVVEIFARELHRAGRKVAILSRGYKKRELPWTQRWRNRLLLRSASLPPRVVSDGRRLLLDSEMSGDEPYMLASNLPEVVVLVDKDRVKSGRYATRKLGCDTLILDDGFQYQRLKHRLEIVLVDQTNPFGNENTLPRGILREPIENLKRADFVFITKSTGKDEALYRKIHRLNPDAEIIECTHKPRYFKDVYTERRYPLDFVRGKRIVPLSGIAMPSGFEQSLVSLGATLLSCMRFSDHHRYSQQEIIDIINHADRLGADLIITTEKDAVRIPRLDRCTVPLIYLRVDIEILRGAENFQQCVEHICFTKRKKTVPRAGN